TSPSATRARRGMRRSRAVTTRTRSYRSTGFRPSSTVRSRLATAIRSSIRWGARSAPSTDWSRMATSRMRPMRWRTRPWAEPARRRPVRMARLKDVNGDGQITLADRTIIGSPHPDFTAGLDLGYRWKNWDLSATVFGVFGNEIFDVQKEFYVFRNFSTNVRRDLLTDS